MEGNETKDRGVGRYRSAGDLRTSIPAGSGKAAGAVLARKIFRKLPIGGRSLCPPPFSSILLSCLPRNALHRLSSPSPPCPW